MKPIPEALRAYFPAAVDDERPWWQIRGLNPGSVKWARNDGPVTYSDLGPEERGKLDRADPLPPPPILVGQVWAYTLPAHHDTTVVVQLLRIVLHTDRRDAVFGTDDFFATAPDLLAHGILLTCPYGYAPWSGPEVP